jgi:signal transduction histidine kinase/ActR/RegA family two-component response regulator
MQRLRRWLAAVRGRDAIERRQAYLLQVFLLIVATVFYAVAFLYALSTLSGEPSENRFASNATAALVLTGLVLVLRRGFFLAVAILTIAFLTYAFASTLVTAQPHIAGSYLALLMLPLVMAGLILPRIGLLATAIAVFVAGELAVNARPDGALHSLTSGGSGNFMFACILVAAIVDQFGGTVRSAFREALAREQELETTRMDLQARTTELQAAVAALETEMAERQRIEAERQEMQARVQEVQKLESLGMLAGGIAHDFNNLLVGIMGNAGLALLELPPGDTGRDRISQIETAARRASELARQMLAYSGKGTFVVTPLDVSELVKEMTQLLRASIAGSVEIRYALEPDPIVIEGDATQLRQVVMNLVVNASDAIGDGGGTITVATGRVRADRAYLSGTFVDEGLEEGDYAVIDVADTGAGMEAATQARIFDPFFTTKTQGRGLGLAAVLGIVRAHHGALKVYSEPGHGSTFKLLLPLTRADVVPDPWASRSATPWHGEGTVLVIDDEPMVRDVADAILRRLGLTVVTAADGVEALRTFSAEPDRFAVVLLDLTMPRLSGAETFRQIREIRPDAAVILMSGYSEGEAGGRFEGKGLAGFLEKPFSTQGLGAAIERVLGTPTPTEGTATDKAAEEQR